MHQFTKLTPAWNSTCFGQFLCPSSRVYSLYTKQWYMLYRFVDSFLAGACAPARKLIWETGASGSFYYKEICHNSRSHERKVYFVLHLIFTKQNLLIKKL
jgi:hypothetical protein